MLNFLRNVVSFGGFVVDCITGPPCPEKPGLAQEEWFLRRAIRRNELRLEDIRRDVNEYGEYMWWAEQNELGKKLERQRERLAILVKKRNGK